jgi:hypothetical protein
VPDGLGDVRHGVAAVGPGGEEADLGLTLRSDGPVEEADARMATARIGEDEGEGVAVEALPDAQPFRGGAHLEGGEAEGGARLGGGVAMMDEH